MIFEDRTPRCSFSPHSGNAISTYLLTSIIVGWWTKVPPTTSAATYDSQAQIPARPKATIRRDVTGHKRVLE